MIRHLLTLGVVILGITLTGWIAGAAGLTWMAEPWIVGVGVMILIAYAFGEFLRTLNLPALLGYILAGILLGPSFASLMPDGYSLGVVTEEVIARLDLIHVLIVGVIGMLAGAKVRVQELSGNFRLLLAITGALLLMVVPATMAAVLLAGQLFPEQLVFLTEVPLATQFSIALLFGVLAFGLSPSITVALLQELRARGPLATVILGVVVVGEFVLFALFAVVLSVVRVVVGPETLTWGAVGAALPGVGWQLLLSLILGVGLGLITANFLRYVRKETLLFVLAALVVGYFGVVAAEAEPLLTFLVAGFFVQNASRQGDILLRALERIALPVFVVYFVVIAAGIDLAGTLAYLPLVVMLVVVRLITLYWAVRWASARAVEANRTYEYLRTAFISQDAVVLVLAGVAAGYFPEWGAQFQSVVIATVIVYLIGGPILLKLGLDRSGETRAARRPLPVPVEVAERVEPSEVVDLEAALKVPGFEDSWLRGHVEDLREELLRHGEEVFFNPVTEQHGQLYRALSKVEGLVAVQAEALEAMVARVDEGASRESLREEVRDLQRDYSQKMQPVIGRLEATPGAGVTTESMQEFFEVLRAVEDQQSLYRIEREESLSEPDEGDPLWVRGLKASRRVRARFVGPGYRTVPVGRLWRYYVELALPVELLKTVPNVVVHYEGFWKRLSRHLRGLDDFWESLTADLSRPEAESPGPSQVARRLEVFVDSFEQAHQELLRDAEESVALVMQSFAGPVVACYEDFLDAVARAGTVQLPAFRTRPSARYGPSRRAESRLVDRMHRQEGIVNGYKGWIRLDHEVSAFEQWTRLFGGRIEEAVEATLGESWQADLEALRAQCRLDAEGVPSVEACEEYYRDTLRPQIAELRRQQEELLARIRKGAATRTLQSRLESRISRVPQKVSVLSGEPERVVLTSASSHFELPLRHWISSQIAREMALRVVEFNERGEEQIEDRLALLSSVDQVLEFNLVTTHREAPSEAGEEDQGEEERSAVEVARQGAERAARAVEKFLDENADETRDLSRWLQGELDQIVARAFQPISSRKLNEVQRELARMEAASFVARGESWLSEALDPVVSRLSAVRRRVSGATGELADEVRSVLVEPSEEVNRFEVRRLLYAGEASASSRAPSIYRRLFVPMPLDIPEFYRVRSDVEDELTETMREFIAGGEHSILITGPPGIGKRSLVKHLIPGRLLAMDAELTEERVHRVTLTLWSRSEEALAGRLGREIFGRRGAKSFDELGQRLRRHRQERRVVVVEHGERVFLRTEDGLAMARRFFEMVEDTADRVLWIVLMGRSAATFLQTQIDLEAHFTHRARLPEMNARELEEMIMARHQVSGFDVAFQQPHLRRLERLKRPVVGSRVREIPREVFFERLEQLSGGNPRAALLYWLKALRLDPVDESRILVEPLGDREVGLMGPLPLRQRLILAQLCVHRTMSGAELASVLGEPERVVRRALRHLLRMGFVAEVPDSQDEYCVRSMASARVERDLNRLNMV